jgi:hypothetical protein
LDKRSFWKLDNGVAAQNLHRLLVKVSEACNLLPASLSIKGVTEVGLSAVFGGGFADIFQATYKGRDVALKRLRLFHANAEEHLKMRRV